MPILAVVAFVVALIFFGLAFLMALPVVTTPEPWKGIPALIGLFFFTLAEFLARGGMPG